MNLMATVTSDANVQMVAAIFWRANELLITEILQKLGL